MHENCKEKMFKITNQQHIYHKVDIQEVLIQITLLCFRCLLNGQLKVTFEFFLIKNHGGFRHRVLDNPLGSDFSCFLLFQI